MPNHRDQEELAEVMEVTQAYVSKIERQKKVTAKTLKKVDSALKKLTSLKAKAS
jgi:transcriptional regulator with XRE-family HTH domain